MISDQFMLCVETHPIRTPFGDVHNLAFARLNVIKRVPAGALQCTVSDIPAPLLPFYTRWVTTQGGRSLLDAWEVQVINSNHSTLEPVDHFNGIRFRKGWYVDEVLHTADGIRLVWLQYLQCPACTNATADERDEWEWGCLSCDGTGNQLGTRMLTTDIDGRVLEEAEL